VKVTIEISADELERIEKLLVKHATLVKTGFMNPSLEDVILARVYDAAKMQEEQKEDAWATITQKVS